MTKKMSEIGDDERRTLGHFGAVDAITAEWEHLMNALTAAGAKNVRMEQTGGMCMLIGWDLDDDGSYAWLGSENGPLSHVRAEEMKQIMTGHVNEPDVFRQSETLYPVAASVGVYLGELAEQGDEGVGATFGYGLHDESKDDEHARMAVALADTLYRLRKDIPHGPTLTASERSDLLAALDNAEADYSQPDSGDADMDETTRQWVERLKAIRSKLGEPA